MPLQHDSGGAFGRDEAIGALNEGARAASGAERLQGVETDVQDQIVGGVNGANECNVYLACCEFPTGYFEGVE